MQESTINIRYFEKFCGVSGLLMFALSICMVHDQNGGRWQYQRPFILHSWTRWTVCMCKILYKSMYVDIQENNAQHLGCEYSSTFKLFNCINDTYNPFKSSLKNCMLFYFGRPFAMWKL
jgi:hypothetical protein